MAVLPAIARPLRRAMPARVPLAWRNLLADKWRLVRSSAGIAFAVLLMLVQLGFERSFFDASLSAVNALDGDLFVSSAAKYRFGTRDPFDPHALDTIKAVSGVATVAPLYADWQDFFWTSPIDNKPHLVRVFAIDPDSPPVFSTPGIADQQHLLQPDGTMLIDRESRRFLGMADASGDAKLNGETMKIAGKFSLGPDFMSDGTVVMSDRSFVRFFRIALAAMPIETAIVRLQKNLAVTDAQKRLAAALPPSLTVMTKAELVQLENDFQAKLSSAAPIFFLGALVGFAVGTLISYQIIYTELSDRLPQYATLKGIGYGNGYLIASVLRQAMLIGIAGYVPAWLLCLAVYRIVGSIALLPLHMSLRLTLVSLILTLGMCLLAAVLAIRRVIRADPAEIF
ncbi:MAG TPA: FtsX-like permease family protein [Stellaceae bacterium]|jgi:putative ABC transport system permease protein|nr:FtsX-like permease family protein [Stellaceae bacterium]